MSVKPHETVQPDDMPREMMHHELRIHFEWGTDISRVQRASVTEEVNTCAAFDVVTVKSCGCFCSSPAITCNLYTTCMTLYKGNKRQRQKGENCINCLFDSGHLS